ncbi:unnamed protein product, partial [Lampetra fluviatilis]
MGLGEYLSSRGDRNPGTRFVGGGGRTSSKILRLVDKITKSRYFQRATENEFIKKKMEEVSNTPLMLTVSLQECQGALALNIPPPPTDRIWYGFRSPPRLELKARPKLGERTVTFTHVTEWIESKLEQEFQKILVMPNMDDLFIPVMQSAPDTRAIAPQFRASRVPADGRHAAVPGDLASQGGAAGPGLPPRRGARGQRGACPGGVAHQDDPRAGGEEGLPGGRRGAREAQGARGGQGDVRFPAEEAQEEGAAIASRRGAGGGPPGERGVPAGKADVRQDRPHPPQGLLRPGLLLRAV